MKTHQLIRNELDKTERLRLFRKLRLIAVRKGIPDHEVDDLAQECFQKVWKCLNNRELSCKCGGAFDNAQCQRCSDLPPYSVPLAMLGQWRGFVPSEGCGAERSRPLMDD